MFKPTAIHSMLGAILGLQLSNPGFAAADDLVQISQLHLEQ